MFLGMDAFDALKGEPATMLLSTTRLDRGA